MSTFETETNNTFATATAVAIGTSISGQLSTSKDVDVFKVTASLVGTLSVVVDVPTNSTNSDYFELGLYNSAGTLLSLFTTGSDKTYTVGAPAVGTYFIGIDSTYVNNYNFSSGQYILTVSNAAGGANAYEAESNNTRATANAVALGTAITGQLATSADVDFYSVAATSAGTLSVVFDVPTSSTYSDYFELGLYNSTGTLLSLFTTGVDKTYTVGAPAAGTYYIGIDSTYANNYNFSSGQYIFTVSNTAGGANTYEAESNNTRATANAVALGTAIKGQLASSSDIDYFSVAATTAGTLSVVFDVPTSSTYSDYFELGLYNSTGTLLSLFSTGTDKTYTVGVSTAGTYYIGIDSTYANNYNYSSGQYSLTVSNTAGSANVYETESNNTRATANALTLGTAMTGQLSVASDVDYYTFSAASAGVVSLGIKTPTNSAYSYFKISVYDEAGLQINTMQTGADANWNVNVHGAGKYYVAIAGGTYYNSGQYSLSAASVPGTVVTTQNQTINIGASIKASSLIASVSDPANHVITSYSFWDTGAGGGYLSLNGVKQASASWVTVAVSEVSKLVYVGGSVAGVEDIDIAAYNGIAWSSYAVATVTTKASALPTVLVQNQSVTSGDAILASSLIASYSDPNQLSITSFRFLDEGSSGGYLTLSGVKQASSTWVTVTAADLSKVGYTGGDKAASEYVEVEVYNGHDWSDYQSAAVTTKDALPAVLTVKDQTVDINASVKISSLISTVRDPNNYAVTSYRFWDEGSGGGYLSLNGVKQASATWVVVDAASLSSLVYVGGTAAGRENVDVEAWNGHLWSTSVAAEMITKVAQYVNPPVVTTSNQSVNVNASIQALTLIDSVTDPSGYQITSYQFRDNGIGGGYFIFNNSKQNSGEWITVGAAQMDKLLYVGGASAGAETVDIAAYDDHAWSTYKTSTLTTTAVVYAAPVVVAQNQTVSTNSSIQAITLIASVTEPNNFSIASYGFWDEGLGGGYLALDGVKQVSGKWIVVSAADIAHLSYVGGSTAGVEKMDIVASNGQVWSGYASADVTTAVASLPVITTVNRTVAVGEHIATQSLIGTVNDPAGLPILSYAFRDEGSSGGYLSLDGVAQTYGNWIVVAADKVATLNYFAGTQTGVENVDVKVQDANGWSNYSVATVLTQGSVAVNPVVAKLSDATIKSDVTAAAADNSISYNEMLSILNDAMLAGVTADEFNDLKTLVSYFNKVDGVKVDAYVSDISSKVINGDPANQYWTGGALTKVALGNLAAGSSQTQMDELIKKWFLGGDLPQPDFGSQVGVYKQFNSSLYGSSGTPLVSDINQLGFLGDCYLLASLVEVANCEPDVIKSMITDNGNGTYGIRFYIQSKPVYVTVNQSLPVDANGNLLGNTSSNLWSSLIEKAYVQLNEEPGYLQQTVGNVYKNIDGGLADPITQITGRSLSTYDSAAYTSANWLALKSTIVTAIKAGLEVDFGDFSSSTHVTYLGGKIAFHGGHMFAGIGYDDATGSFIIRNPWGVMDGQSWNTEFKATMAELYSEHGVLFVANGSLGAMAFSTSLGTIDNVPPVVTSFSPLSSASNVNAATNLVAVFSEDIQRGTGLIVLKTAAGVIVESYDAATSSNLNVTGATLTINPTADLANGTTYSVDFASGSIKDLAGNDYAGTTSYGFTTTAQINSAPTGVVTVSGTATQGQTLTAISSLADADGLGTLSYQWKADGSSISGATSSTLTLAQAQVGKAITVVASYTDGQGTAESVASTATVAVVNVNDAPTSSNATLPGTEDMSVSIALSSFGFADVDAGDSLASVKITALPTAGQLLLNGADVSLNQVISAADITANKLAFAPAANANGNAAASLKFKVSDGNLLSVDDYTLTFNISPVNDAPTGGLTINGTVSLGQTLTAVSTLADVDGMGTLSYQWTADGVNISGATTASLNLTQVQVGKAITVLASYTDGQGNVERVASDATALVANVNDAPTFANVPANALSHSAGVVFSLDDVTVADVDSTNLSLSLVATNGTVLGLTDADANTAGTQLSGTAAQINAAFAKASFVGTAAGAAGIELTLSDHVNTPVVSTYPLSITAAASATDTDGDGVANSAETGDANGDGIADAYQSNVASTATLTLVAQSTQGVPPVDAQTKITGLTNVTSLGSLTPPAGMTEPGGVLAFNASVTSGKEEHFSLLVANSLAVNGYWQQNSAGAWVNLAAEINGGSTTQVGNTTRLDFVVTDGGAFDSDHAANGVIVDTGLVGHLTPGLVGMPTTLPDTDFWF